VTTTSPPEPSLSTTEAGQKIDALPYPRVTKQAIEAKIASTSYFITNQFKTICVIELRNGFEVSGEAACADKRNYDREIGKRLAYDDAFRKIWPLEGYLLRDTIWKASQYLPEDFLATGRDNPQSHQHPQLPSGDAAITR
jgi:hypothetical protein